MSTYAKTRLVTFRHQRHNHYYPKDGQETLIKMLDATTLIWYSNKNYRFEQHTIKDNQWQAGRWTYCITKQTPDQLVIERCQSRADNSLILRAVEVYRSVPDDSLLVIDLSIDPLKPAPVPNLSLNLQPRGIADRVSSWRSSNK